MIRKVLVALDASEHAKLALDLGAGIAAKYDAELVLLHVVFGGEMPEGFREEAVKKFEAAETAGAWTSNHPEWSREHQIAEFAGSLLLTEASARAETHGATKIQAINDFGSTVERILEHAETLPADMIVMGARGTGGIANLFIGSTSHAVLHRAPCTAVAVHHGGQTAGLRDIKRILVPVDGSEHAEKAVTLAGELAGKAGAKLILAHVLLRHARVSQFEALVAKELLSRETQETLRRARNQQPGYPPLSDVLTLPQFDAALQEIGRLVLSEAERKARAAGAEEVETKLFDGEAAKAIVEIARAEQVDMIAMGTRGLGQIKQLFVGSVSYKVSHSAPCTTMVVR